MGDVAAAGGKRLHRRLTRALRHARRRPHRRPTADADRRASRPYCFAADAAGQTDAGLAAAPGCRSPPVADGAPAARRAAVGGRPAASVAAAARSAAPCRCWPATAGHERRQPDPTAALGPPPALLTRVGLPPHQGRARAGERHRPEQVLAEPPTAGLHQPQQPGAERGQRQQGAPVDPPLGFGRGPQSVATGRLQSGGGLLRLGRQQQPQGSVRDRPEELDEQQADEADPDHHHGPAQVPGQSGADATEDRPLGDPSRPGSGRLLLGAGTGAESGATPGV